MGLPTVAFGAHSRPRTALKVRPHVTCASALRRSASEKIDQTVTPRNFCTPHLMLRSLKRRHSWNKAKQTLAWPPSASNHGGVWPELIRQQLSMISKMFCNHETLQPLHIVLVKAMFVANVQSLAASKARGFRLTRG